MCLSVGVSVCHRLGCACGEGGGGMGTVVRKKGLSLSTCFLYVSHYDNSLVEQILSSNLQMRKKKNHLDI